MKWTKRKLKDLLYKVNSAAREVHKSIGPGLLESVYHKCMKQELKLRKLFVESECQVPVIYKGETLETNLRCDFLVKGILIVELKAVDYMVPIYDAQLLTYMNLLNCPLGVLYNFNVSNIYYEGQKTMVNELYRVLEP